MRKWDTFFFYLTLMVRHYKLSLNPLMASFLYSYNTARCHSKLWWRPLASVVKWLWSLIQAGVDNLIALNALTQPNDFAVILALSGNSLIVFFRHVATIIYSETLRPHVICFIRHFTNKGASPLSKEYHGTSNKWGDIQRFFSTVQSQVATLLMSLLLLDYCRHCWQYLIHLIFLSEWWHTLIVILFTGLKGYSSDLALHLQKVGGLISDRIMVKI